MAKKIKEWNVAQLLVASKNESVKNFSATIKSVEMTQSTGGDPIANVELVDASSPTTPIVIEVWNPTVSLENLPAGSIFSVDKAYVKEFQNSNRLGVSMFFAGEGNWPDGNPKKDSPAGIAKVNGKAITGAAATGVKATGTNNLDKLIVKANTPTIAATAVKLAASKWVKAAVPKNENGKYLGDLYTLFDGSADKMMQLLDDADLALLQKIEAMPAPRDDFPLLQQLYAVFDKNAEKFIAMGIDENTANTLSFIETIVKGK